MSNNSRIAKNTFFLYIRMFIVMGISLYTSRIVLNQLGVIDYGIYNVVGGVVTMLAFLNSSMASSTQRFLTIDLGKKDLVQLNKTFNTSIQIHLLVAILVTIIAETIGLWFFYHKMQIPTNRIDAALWVYQTSIISMFITFVNVPYNAIIIAYERMGAFAYLTIFEVVLKLIVAFLLVISPFDKLKFYAILMMICPIIIRIIYMIYCNKNFTAIKIKRIFDLITFKEMSFFAGWSLWGQIAYIFSTQGLNILLNLFFGPVVNAARGIAVQIQSAVSQFSLNFQTAINPQIIKSYAQEEWSEMHSLICRSAKFTFFLLYALILPIFFGAPFLIKLWLGEIPEYTVSFLRIILFVTIIDSTANPLMVAASATGNIKKYQATIGGLLIAILPLSYIFLKVGYPPISVFIVHLMVCIIAFICRIYIVKPLIHLSAVAFFKGAIKDCFVVGIISPIIPIILYFSLSSNIFSSISIIIASFICVCLSTYFLGLNKLEKNYLKKLIKKITNYTHD